MAFDIHIDTDRVRDNDATHSCMFWVNIKQMRERERAINKINIEEVRKPTGVDWLLPSSKCETLSGSCQINTEVMVVLHLCSEKPWFATRGCAGEATLPTGHI